MQVDVIAEVSPGRIHGIEPYLPWIMELVDAVDIPESPLGVPHPNSIAVAAFVKARYGMRVYAHMRVKDLNEVALLSHAYAVKTLGIDGLVLIHGEGRGNRCNSLTTEEAVTVIRSTKGLENLRIGAILSLKYSPEEIMKRVTREFDFFLIIRFPAKVNEELHSLLKGIKGLGKKVYTYIIVRTDVNKEIVEGLNQPFVMKANLKTFINEIEDVVDGVILSVPKDGEGLRKILKELKKR